MSNVGANLDPLLGDLITSFLIFWLPIPFIFYLCKVLLMFQGKMLRMRRLVFWKVVFDTLVCNVVVLGFRVRSCYICSIDILS